MGDIKRLTQKVVKFRDARNWKQFHNPKDTALSLVLEAAELLEHFQWKDKGEIEKYLKKNLKGVGEELADVLYWVLLISNDLGINLVDAFERKLKINAKKYPLRKSHNNHSKYTEL